MPSLHHVRFDSSFWRLVRQTHLEQFWSLPEGDTASFSLFEMPPDVSISLADVNSVRSFYRDIVTRDGGALISADVIRLGDHDAIKLVLKFRESPHSRAVRNVGSLALLFADCSYIFRVESVEKKLIGMRESSVFTDYRRQVGRTTAVPPTEWARDPYDPTFESPFLRNRSDDEQWDPQFPDHPLSRVRRALAQVESTFESTPELKELRPFNQSLN